MKIGKLSIYLLGGAMLLSGCTKRLYGEKDFIIEKGVFEPTWESLGENNVFPEWFRDAKFGIWAHWGVQCAPEASDWYARNMYLQGNGQYKDHLERYGHPSETGFMDIIPTWKAENWNPEALIKLYKRAGAKYFVAMANHHDNFDNYDSKYQAWNSVNMGPKRDLIAGWEKAARAEGLKFGVSNHAAHAWRWYQAAYGYDPEGGKAGIRYDAYHLTKKDGKGKWWQGYDPQDLYTGLSMPVPDGITSVDSMNRWHKANDSKWLETIPENNPEFAKKWFLRTKELLDKYQPDLIYFDDYELPLEHYGLEIAAHYYNSSAKRNDGINQAVITAKELSLEHQKGVMLDCERGSIGSISPYPWQTCSCIGSWHYDKALYERGGYKSVALVAKTLVDIVSKNGNLLLSIPVKSDGSLDDKELAFLDEMAAWMDIHGEGIYGSRPWKIFGEGAANTSGEGDFGAREKAQAGLSAKDVRFTAKDGKLYVFFLGFPETPTVEIKALGFDSPQIERKRITSVKMLGTEQATLWNQKNNKLVITVPEIPNTGKTVCFVVEGIL